MPLKFGETPWDGLSREELLLNVQRMFSAIVEAESVIRLSKGNDAGSFWSEIGSGGRVLEMIRQIRAPIDCLPGSARNEELYRAFYRYANDLLFDRNTCAVYSSGWRICEKDGEMLARLRDDPPPTICARCGGPLRLIEWKDLKPT